MANCLVSAELFRQINFCETNEHSVCNLLQLRKQKHINLIVM